MLQPNVQHYIVPHCNRLNWSFTQFTLITLSLKPSPCQSRCCTVWFQFEFDFQIWIKFVELHYNCIALLHLYSPAIRVSWILKEILTLNKTCWISMPCTVFCTVLHSIFCTVLKPILLQSGCEPAWPAWLERPRGDQSHGHCPVSSHQPCFGPSFSAFLFNPFGHFWSIWG